MFFFLEKLTSWLGLLLFVLLSVAFFTLLERHVLSSIQRRQGPNIIGFYGILQAIADGVKLILKETVIPRSSDYFIFLFAPVFTFMLALSLWAVIPSNYGFVISDFEYGIIYIFTISSLSVHSVIMAGWSSNSKYAFLGALRSAAQMISYEVSIGVTLLSVVLLTGTLNLTEIVLQQKNTWFILPLFPMFLIFFICSLAETNRHPFDLPEAESELVSGYNVEYAAVGFALFFLAEYSNIIVMCILTNIFFLGGWSLAVFENTIPDTFLFFSEIIVLAIKTFFFMFVFILIRATIPRFRYDQLMRLGWKIFLPFSLGFFIFLSGFLFNINLNYSIIHLIF